MTLTRAETEAAYDAYLAVHHRKAWPELADLFAEDASYEDPFFGRVEGREAIRAFLTKSMTGLEEWSFPIQWVNVAEGRVVSHWLNRLPGERQSGGFFEFPGVSMIHYRPDGKIGAQMDLYDRVRALQVIGEGKSPFVERSVARLRALSEPLVMAIHRRVAR
ncbi:MAG: nuclear transport factor 2 family protein [Myxococcales bacterium]|nr:nuclear transport factor 2 family protein [Myxococcales bacterium]